ncbi:MAG: DsbC family protein [Gammaproteobacteria bacterium]
MMRWILFLLFSSVLVPLYAESTAPEQPVTETITTALKGVFPDLEVTRIRKSRIDGLYEVMLGPEVIYVSGDGRFLFQGNLLDLQQHRNLSEEQRKNARVDLLRNIPKNEFIEFAPEHVKHTIYVFTDITCPYCQRLHKDMPTLNKLGIAVRYLAFPRAGVPSRTYEDMESVWCAADRNKALTDAKLGKKVKSKQCNNPVAHQFALGQAMGVRGTPAIYLENGRELPGYMPPKAIAQAIQQE